MAIYFVGANPKHEGNLSSPFKDTRSGKTLGEWFKRLDLRWQDVELRNASDRIDVTASKLRWNDRSHLVLLELLFAERSKIVTLGTYPSKVLTRIGIAHYAMPHPSGLNRKLNDPTYVAGVLAGCQTYLSE